MSNPKMKLVFSKRDAFYNNGLVNLSFYRDFKNKEKNNNELFFLDDSGIELKYSNAELEINGPEEKIDIFFKEVANKFFTSLISDADNKRWYFDTKKRKFVKDYGINIKGATRNDKKNAYKTRKISDLGGKKELFSIFDDQNLSDYDFDKFKEKILRGREGNEYVYIYQNKQQISEHFVNYITTDKVEKEGTCELCRQKGKLIEIESSTAPWLGPKNRQRLFFRDLLSDSRFFCTYCNLFYQLGVLTKRYYRRHSSNFYFYLDSSSLVNLLLAKMFLNIQDKDKLNKDGETTKSNIGGRFKISNISYNSVLFKIIMVLNEKVLQKENKTNLNIKKETFQQMKIQGFERDGSQNKKIEIYNKLKKIFKFVKKLRNLDLLNVLADHKQQNICSIMSWNTGDKSSVLLYDNFIYNLINFNSLRSNFMEKQFQQLQEDNPTLPKGLEEFNQVYLDFIKKEDDKEKLIHKTAAFAGKEIGRFMANIEEKKFLFNLRNVSNADQLIEFFEEFEFRFLKSESEDSNFKGFKSEFQDYLQVLLDLNNSENWKIIRDYLAIYAISKYQNVKYAKHSQES